MSTVKHFYNRIQFPGLYTTEGLQYHEPEIRNRYLAAIDTVLGNNLDVLDVGCGTGLISNLFAKRYPNSFFTGIDFASGVDYAKEFSAKNNISNTNFIRQDFLKYTPSKQYDVVISQGVLHHIPDFASAVIKIKQLVKPGGFLALGLYHPWGKLAKKFVNINYKNSILHLDQEEVPFESSFTVDEVKSTFNEFIFCSLCPSLLNTCAAPIALLNYKNGGLITYILRKSTATAKD